MSSGTRKCPGGCGRSISSNANICLSCCDKPTGELSILNVGTGDIKILFNTASAPEVIRAKRIVTDMLRRGYALVVEIERNGERAWERVREFDEKRGEYIIADMDPLLAREVDMQDEAESLRKKHDHDSDNPPPATGAEEVLESVQPRRRGRPPGKRLPMTGTRATAIGRSAGG